jgi:probable rRNA maturation factor
MGKVQVKVQVFHAGLLPPSARKPGAIRRAVLAALKSEKAKGRGELNVIILDRKRMREMNRMFLSHNHDTDVIAFRYDPNRRDPDSPFGDVYISAYMARLQAKQLKHSVLEEAQILAVHGTLHLLGYDDHTLRQRRTMFKRQDQILHGQN